MKKTCKFSVSWSKKTYLYNLQYYFLRRGSENVYFFNWFWYLDDNTIPKMYVRSWEHWRKLHQPYKSYRGSFFECSFLVSSFRLFSCLTCVRFSSTRSTSLSSLCFERLRWIGRQFFRAYFSLIFDLRAITNNSRV